jgi:hypothetical protein
MRSAIRRITTAILALGTVAAFCLTAVAAQGLGATPPPVEPQGAEDALEYAWQGEPLQLDWTGASAPKARLADQVFGDAVAVPGDEVARRLKVTNVGPTAGELTVDFSYAARATSDLELAKYLRLTWAVGSQEGEVPFTNLLDGDPEATAFTTDVPQGESVLVTLGWSFPYEATGGMNQGSALSLDFGMRLTLTEDVDELDDPLPKPTVEPRPTDKDTDGDNEGRSPGPDEDRLPFTGTTATLIAAISGLLTIFGFWALLARRRAEREEAEHPGSVHPRG